MLTYRILFLRLHSCNLGDNVYGWLQWKNLCQRECARQNRFIPSLFGSLFISFSFIILFRTLLIVLQALLSGCSAGGLASILHCDEFRGLFSGNTKVKCLSDAGMFLDA